MNRTPTLFCIVYRIGGTHNFRWLRSIPIQSREAAEGARRDTEKMGYKALVAPYYQSLNLGLPETFEAEGRS